jgi:hypothetical protein
MNVRKNFVPLLFVGLCLVTVGSTPVLSASSEGGEHGGHAHEHGEQQADERSASDQPYDIHFSTHPKPKNIIPDQDKVELLFRVTHEGEPAENVDLSYRVHTPPENFWFRTDFPVVEGSQLVSGTVHLPTGNQVISMILPIRGTYTIKTTARGPEGTTSKTLQFDVSENPQEIINLSVFLVVLFLIGGVGGYFLSGQRTQSTPASWLFVVLAASVFSIVGSPRSAMAHGKGNWDPHKLEDQKGVTRFNENFEMDVKTFPEPVTVGEMLNVRYNVGKRDDAVHADGHGDHSQGHDSHAEETHAGHDEHTADGKRILAESHFVHSEGGLEMVKQTHWLNKGSGAINVQLFDGAPHYLVTRFYRPTEAYRPAGGHGHGTEDPDQHGRTSDSEEGATDEHGHEEGSGHEGHHRNGEDHDDHAELGPPPWEARFEFHLEPGQYQVKFQESGDPAMKWLLLSDEFQNPEIARRRFKKCASIGAGTTLPDDGKCHDLKLNPEGTRYQFEVSQAGRYRLYTEHLPREFDMTITHDGTVLKPERKFITGKGEYIGRSVNWVEVDAVQPPFDSIFKAMSTLLLAVGLGFFVGYKGPEWMG